MLEAASSDESVDAAIEATGTREPHRRRLPTHLVVTLVVAMGLLSNFPLKRPLPAGVAPTLPPVAVTVVRVLWP
ncbi:MAG: transposase domain-containing protein [Chloroflexota bacterium]|nr:transposase domain-containing protein [Chloroflexota bacterium]